MGGVWGVSEWVLYSGFDRQYDYGLVIALRSLSSKGLDFVDQVIEKLRSRKIPGTPFPDRFRGAFLTK